MPLWGKNDAASNSVISAAAQVKVTPNTANRDALFGNTTANAFITGVTVGQFGVDASEIAAEGGKTAHTGWVLRTVGQGGRAGRVMNEVLVAGGIGTDAEDVVFPDYTLRITTQPTNKTANSTNNDVATFNVVGASTPTGATLGYLWTYANGDTIGVETSNTSTATLSVDANAAVNATSFKVTVSATGAVNVVSTNAVLTVTT